jgi:type I restriction enzyme S subunit
MSVVKIDLNKLDKSDWKTYRFDEIAKNISERVDPNNTDLTVYIGLEHIDSESLHIKRHGTPDDVNGTKLKFYKGDIIFGRRRAYQRKAGIATWDGFCSAHALVLRANLDVISSELFPFFLHSDLFMNRAVDISVGSLSPTINWGTLKHQEFLVPPKELQYELSQLFCSIDELTEADKNVLLKARTTKGKDFETLVASSQGDVIPLSKILRQKKGKSQVPHERRQYIGLEHIKSGAFSCSEFGDSGEALAQCNLVNEGDLCYSKLRPYLDKAFIADFDAVSTTELLVYETTLASKQYVLHHLHNIPFINYVTGKGFGTKMPRVNQQIIGEYNIKVLKDEKPILDKMALYTDIESSAFNKINNNIELHKSVSNKVF